MFVSGQDVGVLGQVTRAGTAGDVLAPMVVDALITEAAAARQRGVVGAGSVTVALPGDGLIRARGNAAIGQKVFVRDDVIEGVAPSLLLAIIEI